MKATRHNGRSGKMALIIPGIMIAVSTWKTVNILMLEESEKIFTGTVTVAIPQCRTGKKILRISVLRKLNVLLSGTLWKIYRSAE